MFFEWRKKILRCRLEFAVFSLSFILETNIFLGHFEISFCPFDSHYLNYSTEQNYCIWSVTLSKKTHIIIIIISQIPISGTSFSSCLNNLLCVWRALSLAIKLCFKDSFLCGFCAHCFSFVCHSFFNVVILNFPIITVKILVKKQSFSKNQKEKQSDRGRL